MHDYKNIFLAWVSAATSLAAAIELKTVLAIVSAVVLPMVFFIVGKTADIALQIYFKRRDEERRKPER